MARRRKTPCLSLDRGFTLIEILVAIAIMSILLAIALPDWGPVLSSYRLSAAQRQVYADLQRARMRAIAENRRFRVKFFDATETYQIQRESTPGSGTYDTTWEAAKSLPPGVNVQTDATITFQPRGTADAGSARLCNNAGGFINVCVGGTGRVRVATPTACGEDCPS